MLACSSDMERYLVVGSGTGGAMSVFYPKKKRIRSVARMCERESQVKWRGGWTRGER